MNPMLQSLNQSKLAQNLTPIKNMMQMIKSSGNPQMMFQQMLSQNEQIQQVMQYINNNGGNAEKAFYKLAAEKGINPNEILQMLK